MGDSCWVPCPGEESGARENTRLPLLADRIFEEDLGRPLRLGDRDFPFGGELRGLCNEQFVSNPGYFEHFTLIADPSRYGN